MIIGGSIAEKGEYPHMVALGYRIAPDIERLNWFYGGSLISELFVLTAASAAESSDWGPAVYARLGTTKTLKFDHRQLLENYVKETILHPEYDKTTYYNDIALLRLYGPIFFSRYIQPACLDTGSFHDHPLLHTVPVIATGWGGDPISNTFDPSYDLSEVEQVVVSNDCCSSLLAFDKMGLPNGVKDSMICATSRYHNLTEDVCHGDTGGPL